MFDNYARLMANLIEAGFIKPVLEIVRLTCKSLFHFVRFLYWAFARKD